jgi:hypothetical protein
MERNRNISASDSIMAHCRLCTRNDDEALNEHLAEKLWDSRIARSEAPIPWEDAGATWQAPFCELAVSARQSLTD